MNQAESISDSDSNTSSSWVFIDDCPSNRRLEKNKYYLSCDREPIQELTSHCFNSLHLESETDSDGISIISESDDMKENSSSEEEVPLIEDIRNVLPVLELSQSPEKPYVCDVTLKDDLYFNKYVIVGWIIVAMITPVLLNNVSTYMEKMFGNDNDEFDFTQPEISDIENLPKLNQENGAEIGIDGISEIELLPSKEPSRLSFEKKKRLDSKGEIDEYRLECKDNFCAPCKINTPKRKEKNAMKFKKLKFTNEYVTKQSARISKSFGKNGKINSVEEQKKSKYDRSFKFKGKEEKKAKEPKKNDILHNKGKREDDFSKIQKKKKTKNEKKKSKHANTDFHIKEVKKLRKLLGEKDKDIKELIKLVKTKDRSLKLLEYKVLKQLNSLRKSDNADKNNGGKTFHELFNKSGDWYHNLYKGRNDLRKEERMADWVFDRATSRNMRRNMKNNWYWNWMGEREQLRAKDNN